MWTMRREDARPVEERFWEKVIKGDGCWGWRGKPNSFGYGRLSVGSRTDGTKRNVYAHVVSYVIHFGPLPDGMWVLHHCDNPICTRPDHLYAGTAVENGRDVRVRRRSPKRRLTHCVNGHEFTPENTHIRRNGCRLCRACARERNRLAYASRSRGGESDRG